MPGELFSCWLIGAGSLLAECGDVLLRRGHEVQGVITRAERIADWARARRLTVLDPQADLAAELARRRFEHLFSIAHLSLVPDSLLRLPTRSAINFHDGPLPESAGLNTPAWALIEGRTEHGVSWHVMTSGVDEGPVLAEVRFRIEPDETALSLNAKCFGFALESFGSLVDALAREDARPRAQDLAQRRYFERHRRPRAAAVLDWARPAAELEALVRGLAFGRYENPLGSPKLLHGGRAVVVAGALAQPGEAAEPPGTLLAVAEQELRVATGQGQLALTEFTDLSGKPLSALAVASSLGLAVRRRLDALPADLAQRLDELDQRLSRAEPHWTRRLAELDPISLPLRVAAPDGRGARAAVVEVALPPALGGGEALAVALTAAFGVYLGRLARRDRFDLAWSDAALARDAEGLSALVSARVPLRLELDRSRPLASPIERLRAELPRLSERGPWLRDVLARHPELAALREARDGHLLPVGVHYAPFAATPALPDGAECALEIDTARGACRLVYAADRIAADDAASFAAGFAALLADFARDPALPAGRLALVSPAERQQQLVEWNRRERPAREACVHELFEEQARRTPSAVALVGGERSLTYAELDACADALAAELRAQGVRRDGLVGLCVERSPELVVAILGTLKAGGAYVPLDPAFPTERLALMLDDSQAAVLVADARNAERLAGRAAALVRVEPGVPAPARRAAHVSSGARPSDLAYVIYTSGSTGRPKGVLVEHRNVSGFFDAIDAHIPHDPPGTWMAVTSPSFDISVLELLWTLTRGFKLVLPASVARGGRARTKARPDFSLFYFSSDEGQGRADGYRLLLEGARFADAHGFRAVWTPERHFHAFGGLFPNPAVSGAALAAITQRVGIRAGSVVLPLHHPVRVAEDWALVDNLSGGRVGISFASGWHPHDFVLAPQNRDDARGVMLRHLELVRRLWRGESVPFPGPDGEEIPIATLPRPVQPELPVWITSAGNPETYVAAGRAGANVLTHLLGQSLEQLAPKIAAYREARAAAGHDPATGIVTLMLHTFVGEDEATVAERVRAPLERYLGSSMSLVQDHGWAFPTFRRPQTAAQDGEGRAHELARLGPDDRAALLAAAGERYAGTSGLIGTPERCLQVVEAAREIGVDEIACLIDFGVPVDDVLASLPLLDEVRERAQAAAADREPAADAPLADELRRQGVTHLQCTPSMARMLCGDPDSRAALGGVRHLFVGGEALRGELAGALKAATGGTVTNLYGPTEATIWSSTHAAEGGAGIDPIGRPLDNTVFYVLDEGLCPLPIGATGELFIGGDGVARGYLRRPELDRERFLPDPFAAQPGARMYRTGDLVRCRHDGVFEFLGRTDQQIKLRGHRIEPGEIESLLLRQPGVAEAVVLAEPDPAGDPRLTAYVVPNGTPADPERLRERLAEGLPEYMVPARVAVVGRIPRTPNGKLDRRALAAARPAAPSSASVLAPPRSELETRLARLWCETLGLERVGVEANFFDLGGHSLLVVRILGRMGEVTSRRVTLTDLFRFPTIRSLARFLSSDSDPGALDEATERGRRRRERLRPGRKRLRGA